MATLREVAKKAGVSLATASRVANGANCVNEETRTRVLNVMHDLNYTYVYHQNSKRNLTIAMLIPKRTMQEISLHPSLLSISMGIVHECDECKVRNTIIPLDVGNLMKNTFSCSAADAFVFLGTSKVEEDTLIPLFQERNIPFVLVNRWIDKGNISYVNVNDYKAIYDATAAMINAGHEKLGMVNGPLDMRNSNERLKGFLAACHNRGIRVNEEWIFHGDNDEKNGREAAWKLADMTDRPTCMMTTYDVMAKGLILGFSEKGIRVPQDVSVVGWGDVDFAAYISPALTTVRMPAFDIGVEATKAAMKLIENPLISQVKITVNCNLIERQSTCNLKISDKKG